MTYELPRVLFLLISFLGYFLLSSYLLKWKFEFIPFIVITLLANLLYIFALFGFLETATYVIYYCGIAIFIVFLTGIFINHKTRLYFSQNRTAILIFISLFAIFYILTRELKMVFWDEFSHWGLIAKEIFYTDHLTKTSTALYAVEYPPILPIIQYLVLKVVRFSEPNMYFANILIPISVCTLFTATIDRKKVLLKALSIFVFLFLSYGFAAGHATIFSLYGDSVLAFTFCGIILIVLIQKKLNKPYHLLILPLIFFLTLIKEAGFLFSLFIISLVIMLETDTLDFDNLRKGKIRLFLKNNKKGIQRIIFISLLIALFILIPHLSWRIYLKTENVSYENIFSNQIFTIGRLGTTQGRRINDYSFLNVLRNLIFPVGENKVIVANLIFRLNVVSGILLNLTIKDSVLLFLGLFIIFSSFLRIERTWGIFYKTCITLTLDFFIFIFFLIFVYMFLMTNENNSPGLIRFMHPIILAFCVVFLWYIFNYLSCHPLKKRGLKIKIISSLF